MSMLVPNSLSRYTFRIPVDVEGFTIVRVEDAYYSSAINGAQLGNVNGGLLVNPVDIALSAQSQDMQRSLRQIRTYEFFGPDTITFNEPVLSDLILNLSIEHTSPLTIPHDLYNKLFKVCALRDVLDNLIMMRSKYTNLATPIGQVELNVDNLIQIRDRLNDEIRETQSNVPPDIMVTFL